MTQTARGRASCATRSATDDEPDRAVARRLAHLLGAPVVHDDAMAAAHETGDHVHAHAAEADESELHRGVLPRMVGGGRHAARRAPGAPEDPDGLRLGDEHLLRGAEEETGVDDAGDAADVAVERGGVVLGRDPAVEDPVAVVGDEGGPRSLATAGIAAEGAEPPLTEGLRERHDLHGQATPRAQAGHELLRRDEDDLSARGGGDDPLPRERAAVALDEIEARVDLVGAVDRDVDRVDQEVADREAERGRERRGRPRCGDAEHLEPPLRRQRPHERLRGPAGAEPDAHGGPTSRTRATARTARRARSSGLGAGGGCGAAPTRRGLLGVGGGL